MKMRIVVAVFTNFLLSGLTVAESFSATLSSGAPGPVCYAPHPAVLRLADDLCAEARVLAYVWGHCDGTVSGIPSAILTRTSDGKRIKTKVTGTIDFHDFKGQLVPLGASCACGAGDEMPADISVMEQRVSQLGSCRQCNHYKVVQVPSGHPLDVIFRTVDSASGQEDDKCVQRIFRAVRPQSR